MWQNMWLIYTMKYYSTIKRNEIRSFVEKWMGLETECNQSERQKQTSYINSYMGNLEKWYR